MRPTLRFSLEAVDFGESSLGIISNKSQLKKNEEYFKWSNILYKTGFSVKRQVDLCNDSSIPVAYSLSVLDDGFENPVTYRDFLDASIKPKLPLNPKEFSFLYKEGVIEPQSFDTIKVTIIISWVYVYIQ